MRRELMIFVFTMAILMGGIYAPLSAKTAGFKLPPFQKFSLKNGLTVYLMEQHEVPLIYVSMVFPAGSIKDGDQHGLALLTAENLLFGTKNLTRKQIEEQLDFLGASYQSAAAKEYAELRISFLNEDQDKIFPLLQEIVLHPAFDADEFNKHKQRRLDQIDLMKEHPAKVIRSYYDKFLFGDHIYGNSLTGDKQTVTALTMDDATEFYHQNYQPAQSAIAVVGDFKSSQMKKDIQKLFAQWENENTPMKPDVGAPPEMSKSRLLLINKDNATETRFMIGGLGITRSNPDYIPVQVLNTILGGRFTSWLNDEMRVNRGLTYGAHSYFVPHRYSGIFAMSSYTRTEKTEEAIDVALEVLNRLHKQGVNEQTLTSARNYIKGQFPPQYETSGDLADLLTDMFIYDFDESFINNFQQNVDEMTVEKAGQIIDKYFPMSDLQFVLIGKSDEIRDIVKKYGDLSEKEIKADGF